MHFFHDLSSGEIVQIRYFARALRHSLCLCCFFCQANAKEENADIPLVTTLHGTDITLVGQHPSYKHAVNFPSTNQIKSLPVSESLKSDTLKFFKITKEIEVITNFIDNTEFEDLKTCQRNHFANEDEKNSDSRFQSSSVKRIKDVLDIFNKVEKSVKSKLLILGDGPDVEVINEFINEIRISSIKLNS